MCTFEKVRGMIKFWAPWSAYFVFWHIRRLNQSRCGANGKIKQIVIWRLIIAYPKTYDVSCTLFSYTYRKVNIIYKVTYVKECTGSIARNFGLFSPPQNPSTSSQWLSESESVTTLVYLSLSLIFRLPGLQAGKLANKHRLQAGERAVASAGRFLVTLYITIYAVSIPIISCRTSYFRLLNTNILYSLSKVSRQLVICNHLSSI